MSVPTLIAIAGALVVFAAGLAFLGIWFEDSDWSVLLFVGAAAALIAAVVFAFVSVSTYNEHKKTDRGRGDAPRVQKQLIDGRTADGVSEFPDGWGNVATKCVWNGYRAFQTTKANGASSLVIVVDPACTFEATGPR